MFDLVSQTGDAPRPSAHEICTTLTSGRFLTHRQKIIIRGSAQGEMALKCDRVGSKKIVCTHAYIFTFRRSWSSALDSQPFVQRTLAIPCAHSALSHIISSSIRARNGKNQILLLELSGLRNV